MLASRTLPPLPSGLPPVPPIPTFVNIPRRYVKSKMQPSNNASESRMEDVDASAHLRKSSRINGHHTESASIAKQGSNDTPAPTSLPSSSQATRKRAASLEDDIGRKPLANGHSPTDNRPLNGATSTGSDEIAPHVCLCQPEPKIPRPRNAFILYRQHHQPAIAARIPGLSAPEISKVIGDQWKAESQDQKLIWQQLAQEEKAKHQEQYPDYRYQPRRPGRPSLVEHTTVDQYRNYRCPKCGGRSIKTPTSPYPSTPTPTLLPPLLSEGHSPTARYLPLMSNLSLESPAYRRRGPGPSSLSSIQVPSPVRADTPTVYSPGTPDTKRRRYNYPATTNGRRIDTPYYAHQRRESLLHMTQLRPSPPNTASTMLPPPRTPREIRRGSVDLNVLVPDQHDQSRSVEAMVMSVPFPIKIKVLGRITPPLKDPGPTSPAIQIRGAIIAIEGDDPAAVKELADWLKDDLDKTEEYKSRIEEPPRPPVDNKDVSFEDYLDLIKEWHGRSKEMIRFITSAVESPDSDSDKDKMDDKDSPSDRGEVKKKPVVILPTYQLHASNVYTSRIPIQDAYSPTDHWQWMATLWRGTVGPDLTIYIYTPESKDGTTSAKPVEVNEEVRCLTVRKEKGSKFTAAALRRVGFEVGEWVRDISNKTSS